MYKSDYAAEHADELLDRRPDETERQHAIRLLKAAAEIEHGLMVQYLYAAYSLKPLESVPPESRQRVREWRDAILTVAREEMGHLMTVHNVLKVFGEDVVFNRPDLPWNSPLNPFPFELRKLSRQSLACFVYAEMPEEDRKHRDPVVAAIETDAGVSPQNDGGPQPIGRIYEKLVEICSTRLDPDDFDGSTYPAQAGWNEWGRHYRPAPALPGRTTAAPGESRNELIVQRIATQPQAVDALERIAGQGEAAKVSKEFKREASHFERFKKIYLQFIDHDGDDLVADVIDTPDTKDDGYGTPITDPAARAWAQLFNVRYRMLLTYISHSFALTRDDESDGRQRGTLIPKAIAEMLNLKWIAGVLTQLPAGTSDGKLAGPPFEMPTDRTPPSDECGWWQRHLRNLEEAQALARDIQTHHPKSAEPLTLMCAVDARTTMWIAQILQGCGAAVPQ